MSGPIKIGNLFKLIINQHTFQDKIIYTYTHPRSAFINVNPTPFSLMKYARLVILGEDGENPPSEMPPYFMLTKERTTIGRSRSADMTMDSEAYPCTLSRTHVVIWREEVLVFNSNFNFKSLFYIIPLLTKKKIPFLNLFLSVKFQVVYWITNGMFRTVTP